MTDITKRLECPNYTPDAVIDTDAYNEVDDQFAIAYLLRSQERVKTVAIYAAPFSFPHISPAEGMEASYREILTLLSLVGEERPVYRGSTKYLDNEATPVESEAARDLAARAMNYTPDRPLYVIAIGAITNVASALLINPEIRERIVVIWLGGHARHMDITDEYNMRQDVAAARVVMSSGVPFVQLPCAGVVSSFTISGDELRTRLIGRGPLADHLAGYVLEVMAHHGDADWTRVLWDVTAVAWLIDREGRFMLSRIESTVLPDYTCHYEKRDTGAPMRYVFHIFRDALMRDLIEKITD